jgi:site-specific DNA recombinase
MSARRPLTRRATPSAAATPSADAVSYLRVSSKEQEKEGFSIPAQKNLLDEYAARHRLRGVDEFVDVETAKQSGRGSFNRMVAFLKKTPSVRKLLVEKTDRLYRNFKDYVVLNELDIEIHFVKENVVLSKDSRSHEKFVHGIKVLMAKNYVDNLSEETTKGLTQKAEEGFWPGQAPVGYRNVVGPAGKKLIEPDPVMGPIFRRVAHWFAEGVHSLEDAVVKAREEGLRTRKGNVLPKSTIHQMLRNPIYSGPFYWKGTLHEGKHTPLISQDIYERIIGILDRRFEKRHRKVVHNFAYARLIECGHCGCALVGELKKKKYVYYRCTHAKQKCPDKHVREEILEEKFVAAVRALNFDQEICDWVAKALRESHGDEKRYHDQAIARLQAEYTRLQNRIDAMYVDKLDGKVTAAFFDEKASAWRAEQSSILERMGQHQGANESYIEDGVRLLELAKRAGELFEKQSAGEKRKMLELLLSNSSWKDGELEVTYRQPFDILAKTIAQEKALASTGTEGSRQNEIWLQL